MKTKLIALLILSISAVSANATIIGYSNTTYNGKYDGSQRQYSDVPCWKLTAQGAGMDYIRGQRGYLMDQTDATGQAAFAGCYTSHGNSVVVTWSDGSTNVYSNINWIGQ